MANPADRVRNLTLRNLREAMNLSQDEFAAALREAGRGMGEPNSASKRLVQRWEAGMTVEVRPVYRRALEAVTGRPFHELGFAGSESGETHPMTGAGARLSNVLVALTAMLEVETDLGYPRPGAVVGDEYVTMLRERTARVRRLDDILGGADTFALYHSELRSLAHTLRRCSYSTRTGAQLAGVLAEQAQQAGWAAFDMGAHARAEQLFSFSLNAAREAGDSALSGNAIALLGYLANQTGRVAASVEIAQAAYREAETRAPAAVRTLLAQRLGWAYATAGQTKAAQQALSTSEQHLERRAGEPIPDWAAWADEQEQRIIEGRCWVELGRPARAARILENALADYDESRARNKALFLTWLATAYLDSQEIDAAAATLKQVAEMAASIASPRLAARTYTIIRRLTPYTSVPQVRELLALPRPSADEFVSWQPRSSTYQGV